MRGAERVVFALGALGEAGEAPALAHGADAVAPAGQDLVRIGLVADVPDQPVIRGIEDVMQGDGELDHAEAGPEMAAGHRHRIDGFGPQRVRHALQVGFLEAAQVGRVLDCIKLHHLVSGLSLGVSAENQRNMSQHLEEPWLLQGKSCVGHVVLRI